MTHGRSEIHRLLELAGTNPSKALGQNFVADPNTVRRIARTAGIGVGDRVVEVGAGLGSLTLALAETGAQVTAIERDQRLLAVLPDVLAGTSVELVEGDAMTLDWGALLGSETWSLVANLPYNIATPLVLDLLADHPGIDRMVVMVQAEVGDRLVAEPGAPECGIPSVKASYWTEARTAFKVGPDVFVPRPRVDSSVIELTRRAGATGTEADPAVLFALVDTAFGQRRKMLRRSLRALGVDEAVFAAAGLSGATRPESLSLQQWGALARAVAARPGGPPMSPARVGPATGGPV